MNKTGKEEKGEELVDIKGKGRGEIKQQLKWK
jgi:hypothetical protein